MSGYYKEYYKLLAIAVELEEDRDLWKRRFEQLQAAVHKAAGLPEKK